MTYDEQNEYFGFHQDDMNYNSIWSCDLEYTRLDQVMYEGEWEGSACKGDGQQKITYEVISKDATIDEILNNTAEKIVFKAYVIGSLPPTNFHQLESVKITPITVKLGLMPVLVLCQKTYLLK
jgi:hypothetical protein